MSDLLKKLWLKKSKILFFYVLFKVFLKTEQFARKSNEQIPSPANHPSENFYKIYRYICITVCIYDSIMKTFLQYFIIIFYFLADGTTAGCGASLINAK